MKFKTNIFLILVLFSSCNQTIKKKELVEQKTSVDPKQIVFNNSNLYETVLNLIYEESESRKCAACSGDFNLINLNLYESNEDYKIVLNYETPYYMDNKESNTISNIKFLNKKDGNIISNKSDDDGVKYSIVTTYEYKEIFKDLMFWSADNIKSPNVGRLKENNSTKEEEDIENVNWLNLNLPDPLESSVFIVEEIYYGEFFVEFSGYDLISKKNNSFEYDGDSYSSLNYLNSDEGSLNLDKILQELKIVNSNQAEEIFQKINSINVEDKVRKNFSMGIIFDSYVNNVIRGVDNNQLPKKIKIIYSKKPRRYQKLEIIYAENASHNSYLMPVEEVLSKQKVDNLQRDLGFDYIDSHTIIRDGKPYYLYFNEYEKGKLGSVRIFKYNNGKQPVFSTSGNIDLQRNIWNSIKPTTNSTQSEIKDQSTNNISLFQAVLSMNKRAANINQEVVEYFETEFEPGKKIYMFFLNSLENIGYSCITVLTPYSYEPIAVDCDLISIKQLEWNEIPGSPKIYY